VAQVYADRPGAVPLSQRIAHARGSWLFGSQADYAAVTTGLGLSSPQDADAAHARAAYLLLDARLLAAWATHLARTGRPDLGAQVSARLLEFRGQPEAEALRRRCAGDAAAASGASAPQTAQAAWPDEARAAVAAAPCPAGGAPPPWRHVLSPRG
jgi:hypothetical protein